MAVINKSEFETALEANLKDLGFLVDIESRVNENSFALDLKINLRKDDYGWGCEYAASLQMIANEYKQMAEQIARRLSWEFTDKHEFSQALKSYESLSNRAKHTLGILCQERGITLESHERELATELYESGLVNGYSAWIGVGGYELIVTSMAMRIRDYIKDDK